MQIQAANLIKKYMGHAQPPAEADPSTALPDVPSSTSSSATSGMLSQTAQPPACMASSASHQNTPAEEADPCGDHVVKSLSQPIHARQTAGASCNGCQAGPASSGDRQCLAIDDSVMQPPAPLTGNSAASFPEDDPGDAELSATAKAIQPPATLMQKLQQGTYGSVCQILDPVVRAGLVDMTGLGLDLQLCPLVLCGNPGTGKTTLAQRLTGCRAIHDPEACNSEGATQHPVKAIFWQTNCQANATSPDSSAAAASDQASRRVAEHSSKGTSSLSSSSCQGTADSITSQPQQISTKEVVVTPTCPEHYLQEFCGLAWSCPLVIYDLPGTRAHPAAARASSKKIFDTYSQLSHAIVLCVVEAGFSDLRAAQVLADAIGAAQDRTIICLTKADLVASSEVQSKIFDRLQGSATDIQDFAGQPCIAVSCQNSSTAKIAEERLENCGKAAAQSRWTIPSQASLAGLNGEVALRQAAHILMRWLPAIRTQLQTQVANLSAEQAALGPSPQDVTAADLIGWVQKHTDFQALVDKVWSLTDLAEADMRSARTSTSSQVSASFGLVLVSARQSVIRWSKEIKEQAPPPDVAFFLGVRALAARMQGDIANGPWRVELQRAIVNAHTGALRNAEALHRFEGLRKAVVTALRSFLDLTWQSVLDLTGPAIHKLRTATSMPGAELQELWQTLRSAMIHEVIMPLKEDPARLASCLPAEFFIKEKDAVAKARTEVGNKLKILQTAQQELNHLGHEGLMDATSEVRPAGRTQGA